MQLGLFDDEVNQEEIILSLQEQYFNNIVNGKKKNEYRFSFLKTKCKAYIYIPKTKQQIVGVLYLGQPSWKNIIDASKTYSDVGDGQYSIMIDWLKNKNGCYVIPIERYVKFSNPIPLSELKENQEFVAPQTYLLLNNRNTLKSLLNNHERKQENQYVKS